MLNLIFLILIVSMLSVSVFTFIADYRRTKIIARKFEIDRKIIKLAVKNKIKDSEVIALFAKADKLDIIKASYDIFTPTSRYFREEDIFNS